MDKIEYKDGYAYVDGYKFRRDTKTGYYLSTRKINGTRKRLHIYIWEKHNGEIPKGYEINHVDENKDNNNIENLECMTRAEHLAFHKEKDYERMLPVWRENLEKYARKKAAEWHKSPEGRAQKSRQQMGRKLKKSYIKRCTVCGKVYRAAFQRSKFCSPNCQSQGRRDSGKDNEVRNCVVCGRTFEANRYTKKFTCSEKCQSKRRIKMNRDKYRGTVKLRDGNFVGVVVFMGKKHYTKTFATEQEAHEARNQLIDKLLND